MTTSTVLQSADICATHAEHFVAFCADLVFEASDGIYVCTQSVLLQFVPISINQACELIALIHCTYTCVTRAL